MKAMAIYNLHIVIHTKQKENHNFEDNPQK